MSFSQLNIHKELYDFYLKQFILKSYEKVSDDELVFRIKKLASFAYFHHTGYFIDGRIENLLIEIGQKLTNNFDLDTSFETNIFDKHICYVATELYEVGGHTRVLSEIISCELSSNQLLILTEQNVKDIPDWFIKKHENHLKIISIIDKLGIKSTYSEKALYLRSLVKNSESVILSIHPYDVIPVIAFSNNNIPNVFFGKLLS